MPICGGPCRFVAVEDLACVWSSTRFIPFEVVACVPASTRAYVSDETIIVSLPPPPRRTQRHQGKATEEQLRHRLTSQVAEAENLRQELMDTRERSDRAEAAVRASDQRARESADEKTKGLLAEMENLCQVGGGGGGGYRRRERGVHSCKRMT